MAQLSCGLQNSSLSESVLLMILNCLESLFDQIAAMDYRCVIGIAIHSIYIHVGRNVIFDQIAAMDYRCVIGIYSNT